MPAASIFFPNDVWNKVSRRSKELDGGNMSKTVSDLCLDSIEAEVKRDKADD